MNSIDGYSFGVVTVEGKKHWLRDVLLLPDGGSRRREIGRWIRFHHIISSEDISQIVEAEVDVIVIGTGRLGRARISKRVGNQLAEKGIELIIRRSHEAVSSFNNMVRNGRKVGCFLHMLC